MQYESKPMSTYISEKLQEIVDLQHQIQQKDNEIRQLEMSVKKHRAIKLSWKKRALRAEATVEALNDRNDDNAE